MPNSLPKVTPKVAKPFHFLVEHFKFLKNMAGANEACYKLFLLATRSGGSMAHMRFSIPRLLVLHEGVLIENEQHDDINKLTNRNITNN